MTHESNPRKPHPRDRALFRLLSAQGGVIRREQMVALGYPPRTIARRVATGMFTAVGRSVLVLNGSHDGLLLRSLVAGQRVWPRGIITGPSAVALHGSDREPPWDAVELPPTPWIVYPHPIAGALVLRGEGPVSSAPLFGVPVADLDTALLHMIIRLPLDDARALAFRSAQVHGAARLANLIANWMRDRGGCMGARRLTELSLELASGAHSQAEAVAVGLYREAGVTGFRVNHPVVIEGRKVVIDIAFPEPMVAVEIDGESWHSSPQRYQSDRARQNRLIGAGWRVFRFTWRDLVDRPERVVRETVSALTA